MALALPTDRKTIGLNRYEFPLVMVIEKLEFNDTERGIIPNQAVWLDGHQRIMGSSPCAHDELGQTSFWICFKVGILRSKYFKDVMVAIQDDLRIILI